MKVEKSIRKINKLRYLIHSIWQVHYTGWTVNVKSPFDGWTYQYKGETLAEALDSARQDLKSRGPALPLLKPAKRAVVNEERRQTARVRLTKAPAKGKTARSGKKRVKLNE